MPRCHFGVGASERRGYYASAANRDLRRGAPAARSGERNDDRYAAARTGAPPPTRGRARRGFRTLAAGRPAAIAVRSAGSHLARRARFDPSGRAESSGGNRRRLPARWSARDAQGRRRRRRSGVAARALRPGPGRSRASASRRRNSSCIRATRRAISRSAGVTSRSGRWPAPPIPSTAPAGEGPETSATFKTSSASGKVSIRSISGAAIRSSRSTFTLPFAISTRCSICSRCPTSRSTPIASDANAIWTRSRW